ncbi:Superfamily II DNA or RNA helicase, SNF2 family [Clostridium sp. USBA 49]|uniref:SNF2 helicase associated domain-containing protein n=1 Tax=Clostridium TaxID=1485 RepID=UPI0009998C44|nr:MULTISPECIES: SNF2 helicase associated domain-containing protein [Clostridium]SKA91067.1 Superfamily II DNA or RNA helicase, SNF2 family [Clostridium sp. USBA 49]
MFDIDEKLMKKQIGDVIYSRGLDLYLRNKVRSIDFNMYESSKGNILHIKSSVESAYGINVYDVNLDIEIDTGNLQYDCNCIYTINNNNICKHCVAVLLKWNREKEELMKRKGTVISKDVDEIIEYFKNNIINNSDKINKRELDLDIKFEINNFNEETFNSIELKVGEGKTYVIKNIKEFLSVAKNKHKVIEFSKNFIYDPEIFDFKYEDKKIIDLLVEIYEMDEFISSLDRNRFLGKFKGVFSGKKVFLNDTQVKKLLDLMKGKKFHIIINDINMENVVILEEDIPLEFDIKINSNGLIIKQNNDIPIPITRKAEYFFYKNNIYKPSENQAKTYIPFFNEVINSSNKSMVFNKKDIEKVAAYVIPNLKEISKNINIDESLKKDLYREDLKTTIYFDKVEESILCDVIFNYGDIQINSLNENYKNNDNKILIRNIKEELNLIALLKSIGFEEERYKYALKDEEKIIQFLTEDINKLQEYADIYYSESFKNMKVYTSSNIKSSIKLNDEDLLEFTFNIDGVDKKELKNILEAIKQKKKYYKLKEGNFVFLENEEIQDIGNMVEYLDIKASDLEKQKVLLSKYNAFYIDEKLKNSKISIEKNKKFRELVNTIKEVKDIDFTPPKHLESIMRDYQKFGFKWLKTLAACGFGGILADEMGLGKTLQTIAFIESEIEENNENKKPSLVVAPTSLIYNWENEIEKFAPNLKVLVLSGSKEEREEKVKEIEKFDIVITSYPLIRKDIESYKNIKFRYCIIDEAQQIKNPSSVNAQSVKDIKADGYFALTGTPIENSLIELWSIFDFLMPGYLLSNRKFSQKYEIPIVKNKDMKALEELNKHIKPFILRRLKKDVIKELPPKIEQKLVVEMSEEQKKLYAAYIEDAKNDISKEIKEKGFNKSKIKILSTLTRLRQICCDPSVFVENFNGESGKMEALDYLLEESIIKGHRILLFSQFTTVLKNIAKRLDNNKIDYMYLDGQTKSEERGKMVKQFNEGKGSVFLISLKAGGTGLNLTGADVVIHFDPWWNPAVEDQATDRAHRIGQKKTVEVIKIIARGTIEEKIYNIQEKKKSIIKNVMNDEQNVEENLISQMTQEEIEELFKI